MTNRLPIDWDIQPLGEMSDAEIARQLDVSRERVRQMRAKRGIPRYVEPDPEWISELGTRSDTEIAQEYDISRSVVGRYRNALGIPPVPTRWDDEVQLGKVSDSVLAEKHGVHVASVAQARWTRGIPAFHPGMGSPKKRDIDWDKEKRLGKVADEVLAEKHGVSIDSVRKARIKRGIRFVRGKAR